MVLRARSTLNVLKADTLPRSTNSVTYLQQAGRQKHKNRHTQKGLTTLSNNEPTQRERKTEIPRETERNGPGGTATVEVRARDVGRSEGEIRRSRLLAWRETGDHLSLLQHLSCQSHQ